MTNYFIFNGINSKDMGIRIEKHNNFSTPQRRVKSISVPGRTGNILIDDGSYENQIFEYELILECDSKKGTDITKKANEISAWLYGDYTYKDLKFSNSSKTYKAVVINKIDIKQMFKKFAKALVAFEAYETTNILTEKTLMFENEGIFLNRNNINHKPILKVYGQGDCSFSVNGEEVKIKGLEDYLVIDCYNMDCYKESDCGEIQNCNNKMYGNFVQFNVGENNITTNNCKVEVVS